VRSKNALRRSDSDCPAGFSVLIGSGALLAVSVAGEHAASVVIASAIGVSFKSVFFIIHSPSRLIDYFYRLGLLWLINLLRAIRP
jgi:hypothetical protein